MSQLEEIKARAEKATDARLKYNDSEDDAQDEALSIRAAFIAEQSSYDVPKLIAALEAVEDLCEQDYMMSPEQIRQAITEALQ